ncbi:MAG: hypothetical protein K8T89_11965 [Planctomycetes bacterium]|nr:hypothetical protein [Planctomycetota bacterium]
MPLDPEGTTHRRFKVCAIEVRPPSDPQPQALLTRLDAGFSAVQSSERNW